MLVQNKIAFSFDGDLLAYSEEDGCLKIWQASTGILKKECFLDFDVYGTCSSLNWSLTDVAQSPKQLRIQKDAVSFKNQLLAIGTTQGIIILYDFALGKLCEFFEKAHTDRVNDLCWNLKTNSLFSCSSDHSLAVYDLTTGKIKLKWKAADQPITSVCVIDDNNMLSSSSSIRWWNINEKSLIKEFKGHATDVFKLLLVDVQGTCSNPYFLSAAVGDIKINVWHLDEKNSKNSIASFVLSSNAEYVDMSKSISKDKHILLSAVTEEGFFQLFEHTLNGVIKKPLLPKMTVHIVSKPNGRDSKPQTIPIIASKVCDDTGFCTIVYGCRKKPTFEKVNISECPKNLTLVRNKCLCCSDCSEKRKSEVCSLIENGFKNEDVSPLNGSYKSKKQKLLDSEKKHTHVTEEEYTEQTDTLKTKSKLILNETRLPNLPSKMKKRLKTAEDELEEKCIIFSERDKNIHTKAEVSTIIQNLSVSTLHQILSNKNEALLNSIFQCTDEEKIKNFTENLSIEDVAAILKELHLRLLQNQRHLPGERKWIKNILDVHLLQLNTNKDLVDILHSIEQLIDARRTNETISKMSTLRGLLRIYQTKATSQELNFPTDLEDMES